MKHPDLQTIYADLAARLPVETDGSNNLALTAQNLPPPPIQLTTGELYILRREHCYNDWFKIDLVDFFARKETYRRLGLLILADWQQRDQVKIFGSDAGLVLFAELLLNIGLPQNEETEFALECESGGNRAVGVNSHEANLFFPIVSIGRKNIGRRVHKIASRFETVSSALSLIFQATAAIVSSFSTGASLPASAL